MSGPKCRLAIAGLGLWSRRAYLPNIALMDDVTVVAGSARSDANRLAAAEWLDSSVEVVADWRALLDRNDVDGLIVAAAPEAHCEMAIEGLKHGLPVLCEKPLAVTLGDCDRALQAERE